MQEVEFVITESGERQYITYHLLPPRIQAIYDRTYEPQMSLGEPSVSVVGSSSFIALDDINRRPQRLKLSRIAKWERKYVKVNSRHSERTDTITEGNTTFVEETIVRYGSEYLTFNMSIANFDKLIQSAGGKITEAKPAKSV